MDFTQIKTPIVPSDVDERDYSSKNIRYNSNRLPNEYEYPIHKIYDQGNTSMCASYSIAQALSIFNHKETGIWKDMSAGFIYGLRKSYDDASEGLRPRDVLKDVKRYGDVELSDFNEVGTYNYISDKLSPRLLELLPLAKNYAIKTYATVSGEEQIKESIYNNGFVLMAWLVGSKIFSIGSDGIIPQISNIEVLTYGGHMSICTGYKYINGKLYLKVVNTWGENWGKNGVGYIPYDHNSIIEFWTMTDREYSPYSKIDVYMQIDNPKYKIVVNDTESKDCYIETPAQIVNSRTMVPIVFLREIGFSVDWLANTKTVKISKE